MSENERILQALVRVRVRDWILYHKRLGKPHPLDDAKRDAVIREVTDSFVGGPFSSQSADPTSELVLSMIEGEVEAKLCKEENLVALACCSQLGIVPIRLQISGEFVNREGGTCTFSTPVIDLSKSFAFCKAFEYAGPDKAYLTDETKVLLSVAARELSSPEARYTFSQPTGGTPELTEHLPEGWGLA